jgi:hypothetical protein
MSETTPDPVTGHSDPFRSDDDARDEARPDGEQVGIVFPLISDGVPETRDRDEPGDRV